LRRSQVSDIRLVFSADRILYTDDAVCVVDNLANGIAAEPLSPAEIDRDRERNAVRLRDDLAAALPELAR